MIVNHHINMRNLSNLVTGNATLVVDSNILAKFTSMHCQKVNESPSTLCRADYREGKQIVYLTRDLCIPIASEEYDASIITWVFAGVKKRGEWKVLISANCSPLDLRKC